MVEENGCENVSRLISPPSGNDSFLQVPIRRWGEGAKKLVSGDTMPVCIGIDMIEFPIRSTKIHINIQKLWDFKSDK